MRVICTCCSVFVASWLCLACQVVVNGLRHDHGGDRANMRTYRAEGIRMDQRCYCLEANTLTDECLALVFGPKSDGSRRRKNGGGFVVLFMFML